LGDEFGRPDDDPDTLEDHLILDGDWIDGMHTFEIYASGHTIKFKRKGKHCIIEIEDKV